MVGKISVKEQVMEHRLTITVPDETFQSLVEAASRLGQTPEEIAAKRLAESAPTEAANGEYKKKGDITYIMKVN